MQIANVFILACSCSRLDQSQSLYKECFPNRRRKNGKYEPNFITSMVIKLDREAFIKNSRRKGKVLSIGAGLKKSEKNLDASINAPNKNMRLC